MPITTTSLLTIVICAVILIIGLSGVFFRRRAYRLEQPTGPITALAPAAAISLGIFGTFLGIYLGLRNFNTGDIDASIPELLEGLKTAFLTSLFGMLTSLGLKYIYGDYDRREISGQRTTSGTRMVSS